MTVGVPGGYLGPDTLDTSRWTVFWAYPGHSWQMQAGPWTDRAHGQKAVDVGKAGGDLYVGWYVFNPRVELLPPRLFWYLHDGSMQELPVPPSWGV